MAISLRVNLSAGNPATSILRFVGRTEGPAEEAPEVGWCSSPKTAVTHVRTRPDTPSFQEAAQESFRPTYSPPPTLPSAQLHPGHCFPQCSIPEIEAI